MPIIYCPQCGKKVIQLKKNKKKLIDYFTLETHQCSKSEKTKDKR